LHLASMKVFSPIVVAVLGVEIVQAARMLKTQATLKHADQTSTSEEASQAQCGSCALFGISFGGWCAESPTACSLCGGDWTACQVVKVIDPPESARGYSSVWAGQAVGTGHARSMLSSPQAWSAGVNRANEWMQIDLGEVSCVAGVVTKARGDGRYQHQRVNKYKVAHSRDGHLWYQLAEVFNGNGAQNTYAKRNVAVQSVFQAGPQHARYIRILAQEWSGHISMRAGLLVSGCDSSSRRRSSSWTGVASTEVAVEASDD